MRIIIRTRNPHKCYEEIEKHVRSTGLYSFKVHDGYLVLITDDDPVYSKLFTVSPLEQAKMTMTEAPNFSDPLCELS
jgi:hypothetical protein